MTLLLVLLDYQVALESITASTRRVYFVTQDNRISPYIYNSNNVLFKFVSVNETPSLIRVFNRSESFMFPACFIFS